MDNNAKLREKTLLCLAPEELAAVAVHLDHRSLGRLSCVSKQLRNALSALDSVWAAKCSACIASQKFNPKKVAVEPTALRDFLGIANHKQLCIALHQLPTCPVGLWYRTDELALPRGEIVAVYAHEDGTYHMSPLDYTGAILRDVTLMQTDLVSCGYEVVQKHKHPNQINLLSNMKRSFAPLRTAGLQTPRPRTPPLHELPEHLPDRFSLTPTLAQPSTTSAQHNQLQPLQHFSSTCLEQEGGPVSVSTASGTPSSPPAGHATRNNSMHGVPHSSIIAPRAAFQAILESEDDDSVGSGGKNRDRDEAAHTLKPQHARTHSTEHIVNSTAPTHSGPGDTAPFRGQLLAPGSPTNSLSCTSSSTHACAVDHRRMHACKSDAQPTNDKAAACIADEHHPPEAALNAAATGNSSDNPAASIAVQWGLLSNACVGDSLGDRLLAEYQVGPCMTPSHMDAVRFTPELNGRAAFMPYSLPCVVRRLSHNSTSGGSAAPSTAPVPPGNNPPTEASAMKCPPGATLLSRASIAHPQSLMFCSVLWPAQLAAGLPPPPLAPGLEQSPAERENSSTMRVVVVGPLLGDGEGRSGMGSQRTGVSSAAQLLQLGFRSPLHWANKRHIQVLDDHLQAFLSRSSDAKVISTYFTGSWTIVQPSLTPCSGGCGIAACSHSALRSMSSVLSENVTFLHLHPREPSTSLPQYLVPIAPGAWDGETDTAVHACDNESAVVSTGANSARQSASDCAPAVATGAHGPACSSGCSLPGRMHVISSEHANHTCIDGAVATSTSAADAGCDSAVPEELAEDTGFAPPHGTVAMEFRRVNNNTACMTERVRRGVVNSIAHSIPLSPGPSGRGEARPGAVIEAFKCLEGLWHGLYSGHGEEVLELSVVRAGEGPCVLPPHLLDLYCNLGPLRWPLPPWRDQVHLMKLRGDTHVPACQLSLIGDLNTWRNGPPDWANSNLPLYYLRQLSEEDDQMEVWPHTQKTILASCEAFCQINKDAGHWAPEWIAAKLLILEEQGNVYLANLINVPFFPHLIEYRPVFLPESDVPGWLPTGFNAATDL